MTYTQVYNLMCKTAGTLTRALLHRRRRERSNTSYTEQPPASASRTSNNTATTAAPTPKQPAAAVAPAPSPSPSTPAPSTNATPAVQPSVTPQNNSYAYGSKRPSATNQRGTMDKPYLGDRMPGSTPQGLATARRMKADDHDIIVEKPSPGPISMSLINLKKLHARNVGALDKRKQEALARLQEAQIQASLGLTKSKNRDVWYDALQNRKLRDNLANLAVSYANLQTRILNDRSELKNRHATASNKAIARGNLGRANYKNADLFRKRVNNSWFLGTKLGSPWYKGWFSSVPSKELILAVNRGQFAE